MEHRIVSHDEWVAARKELLAKEKELSRQLDAVSAARRALAMEKVTKEYTFEGPGGPVTLCDLYCDRRQIIVNHLMIDQSWYEGCKRCSLLADSLNRIVAHPGARVTALVAIARALVAKLLAFNKRKRWTLLWVA